MAAYPLAPRLAGSGGSKKTGQYIIWQLFRRPNHDWTFYPFNVPFAIGLAVVVTALAGLWLMRRKHSWRETLLLAWILVPTVFYQLWPVKGFHYLLTTAPAWAILAARTVIYYMPPHLNARGRRLFQPLIVGIMVFTLFSASWGAVGTIQSEKLLAGTGGTPGGREVGAWISQHTPEGSVFMTLGPSMANILQFYGNRRAYGLSVSSNPLHRNPSYLPILNPDFQLRTGAIQYVVWDAFSASRSEFFEQGLFRYVDRYHGRVVHIETVPVATAEGGVTDKPIIIVYEVRP